MKNLKVLTGESLDLLQEIGLILIAVATIVAFGIEIGVMWGNRAVTLADLLLMFIYLEVLAMVGIYLKSGKLPIRIPLYIAIIALARYIVLDMKDMNGWDLIVVSGSALILALTILVIRFGHIRYPYEGSDSSS